MWVKALGDVIAGFATAQNTAAAPASSSSPSNGTTSSSESSGSNNGTSSEVQPPSSPMKDPPTPWPTQMAQLESVGAEHWDSVYALNRTDGDARAAGDMLGVADLINQVLAEAQGIVDEALGSLSVI